MIPADDIDGLYLAYAVKSMTSAILGMVDEASHGTGRLQTEPLQRLTVAIPPLREQKAIARLLGALDNKIDLNQQTNETLKAMAQALFKSWFVDFDPVRAKMEGRLPVGLDTATAALFPPSLCEVHGALIPEGWRVISLDEEVTFLNGLALQKFPAVEGEPFLPVIKIAQLRTGNSQGADRANLYIPTSHRIDDGDLIFSWSGSLMVRLT